MLVPEPRVRKDQRGDSGIANVDGDGGGDQFALARLWRDPCQAAACVVKPQDALSVEVRARNLKLVS